MGGWASAILRWLTFGRMAGGGAAPTPEPKIVTGTWEDRTTTGSWEDGSYGSTLASGLLACYRFDDDLSDSSGNGQDLTGTGAAFNTGKMNQAMASGSATRTSISGLNDDAFSMSLWLRLGSDSDGNPVTFDSSLLNVPAIHVGGTTAAFGLPEVLSAELIEGEFSHIVMTIANGTYSVYLNGSLHGTTPSLMGAGWSAEDFIVGSQTLVGALTAVDTLLLYSRDLDAAEVRTLYNSGDGFDPTQPMPRMLSGSWQYPAPTGSWEF